MSKQRIANKKKRERAKAKQKLHTDLRRHYEGRYPLFYVFSEYADIEVVEAIKKFCRENDFRRYRGTDVLQLEMLRELKKHTPESFVKRYFDILVEKKVIGCVGETTDERANHVARYLEHVVYLAVARHLQDIGVFAKYFPVHHIHVQMIKSDFHIYVESLHTERSSLGKSYYSYNGSKYTDDKGEHVVSLTHHALERFVQRLAAGTEMSLQKLQIAHLSLRLVSYAPARLRKGDDALVLYLTVTNDGRIGREECIISRLGRKYMPFGAKCEYKVGYCPYEITEHGIYQVKTLLIPGMWNTPESRLLDKMSFEEREFCQKVLVEREDDDATFALFCRFQDSGYQQVREKVEKVVECV